MTKEGLYEYLSARRLAVVSSMGSDGTPQSAVVGIGVTPELDLVFDTLAGSRKARNLVARPSCSLVVGWDNETTVQFEGVATRHGVQDEGSWKVSYFEAWPDGRDRMSWPGLIYFVVSPRWIRYSDFNKRPPEIVEFTF